MSFPNTCTPTKPTCKPKFVVPKRRHANSGAMEYYLTPELEKEFVRRFPVTMNRRMMELFGLSHSTMQRFKKELGLKKDEEVIRRKFAAQIKKTCERNGYYDSIRGKKPSEQCFKAISEKFASGWSPMKSLKEKNPVKYKKLLKSMSEKRKQLIAQEKKRVKWGAPQTTGLHLPSNSFTRSQVSHRHNALKRGYLIGDNREFSGERYVIFYDSETTRSERFEQNCIADGFTFQSL